MGFLKDLGDTLLRALGVRVGAEGGQVEERPATREAARPAGEAPPPGPQAPLPSPVELPPPTVEPPPYLDEVPCRATVRPMLGAVNIRSGPGLAFSRIERASGGMAFGLAGVSGPDPQGFPWYWIDWEGGSGWVRADLVTLDGDCEGLVSVAPAGPEPEPPPPPPAPEDRFSLPTPHRVLQGFHNAHPAYDIDSPEGTAFRAATEGVVIRRVDCTRCTPERPAVVPSMLTPARRQEVFQDVGWGFGYGSFVIVRHDYSRLPAPLRRAMDGLGLSDGFAYVLYAHLSRVEVTVGQAVDADTVLGATGSTGHASGAFLHLEVRAGRDETVVGTFQQQPVLHPALLFREGP